MQWWIPSPNATCRAGSRVMSMRSGSGQRRSSRLADAQTRPTRAPFGITVSWTSTSRVVVRSERLERCLEPEQLLDRDRHPIRFAPEQGQLVGEPIEVEERVRDEPLASS